MFYHKLDGVFMSLQYNSNIIPQAKELRKNMTKQEKRLWYDFLRTYAVRFQRQKTIGNYITDFYCHQAKLIIEVDGDQHYTSEGIEYDKERTAILNTYGLKVIRFTNGEIEKHFDKVCGAIIREIETAAQMPPSEREVPRSGGGSKT